MNNPVKILLAEDEPSLGQIIKESLETRNFEVLLCEDGEQAYKKYKSDNPLLLVLDVMMPKKDGFTLAKDFIKRNFGTIQVESSIAEGTKVHISLPSSSKKLT